MSAPIRVVVNPATDGLLVKVGNSPFIATDVLGLITFVVARNKVEQKKDES